MALAENSSTTVGVNVGVVLDMDIQLGKIWLSCIRMALDDFYTSNSHYKTRLLLKTRNVPNSDVVGAASAAVDLLKNDEVQAIIGPLTSMQANFLVELGDKANVPIISFSATSPSLSLVHNPYFIRATQNDSCQLQAISAIIQAFGWRTVIPIYVGNDFGNGIIPFLTDVFQDIDVRVPYRSIISPLATDDQLATELYKLMTMQTRVFVVHMWSDLGSRLFTKAKEMGMMEKEYVWIITDSLTNVLNSVGPSVIDSMEGVLGVKPYIPVSQQRSSFTVRWKTKFQEENPSVLDAEMDVYGLWAYDATTALATAIEKVGSTGFDFVKLDLSRRTSDFESVGISKSGAKLLQELSSTYIRGVSGDFQIVEGQLQSSAYQLVNVINKGERGIGFWTKTHGITRFLKSSDASLYSTSKDNLGAVVWPGDHTSPPRGWVDQPSGKRLKIGVPVKNGFDEFVKIIRNPDGTMREVTGYCIEVFDLVVAAMPYGLSYDYFPFEKSDGTPRGTYNQLVYQVYAGEFDAVVGDTSITATRANNVDFTLPYTEAGFSLIVPVKNHKRTNSWVFLMPLTWELWVTSVCFFVFIGFAIWILEHRINEDFRGPASSQLGMMLYFSFSTMVSASNGRVLSNLARFLSVISMFVALILTQNYTASLASMLTVQHLQPTVTNMKELLKNNENVGYQQGSFALDILTTMGFQNTSLKVYNSPEECDLLFSNGSIAAAFDGIPSARLFIAKYCSRYTMVEPIYRNDGFGFVFPKGSPLVSDVSRAILNVTEGEKLEDIERNWLGKNRNCPDPATSLSPNSLGLESFHGLFLTVFLIAVSTIYIYITMFLYKHWNVLSDLEPQTSIWQKIATLSRHYDKKDYTWHKFRRNGAQHGNGTDRMGTLDPVDLYYRPNNTTESPSMFSNNTDANFAFHWEQGTPSDCTDDHTQAQTTQEMVTEVEHVVPAQDR